MKAHKKAGLFYGYVIVMVCFCLQAVGWGIFNSLGVFFRPLMDEFGWPRSLVASGSHWAFNKLMTQLPARKDAMALSRIGC